MRVVLNTHAPLTLPGTLSTAGHLDQSRAAMFLPSFSLHVSPALDQQGICFQSIYALVRPSCTDLRLLHAATAPGFAEPGLRPRRLTPPAPSHLSPVPPCPGSAAPR